MRTFYFWIQFLGWIWTGAEVWAASPCDPEDLGDALQAIVNGERKFTMAEIDEMFRKRDFSEVWGSLTDVEREIAGNLEEVQGGLSAVAKRMKVEVSFLETRIHKLRQRLSGRQDGPYIDFFGLPQSSNAHYQKFVRDHYELAVEVADRAIKAAGLEGEVQASRLAEETAGAFRRMWREVQGKFATDQNFDFVAYLDRRIKRSISSQISRILRAKDTLRATPAKVIVAEASELNLALIEGESNELFRYLVAKMGSRRVEALRKKILEAKSHRDLANELGVSVHDTKNWGRFARKHALTFSNGAGESRRDIAFTSAFSGDPIPENPEYKKYLGEFYDGSLSASRRVVEELGLTNYVDPEDLANETFLSAPNIWSRAVDAKGRGQQSSTVARREIWSQVRAEGNKVALQETFLQRRSRSVSELDSMIEEALVGGETDLTFLMLQDAFEFDELVVLKKIILDKRSPKQLERELGVFEKDTREILSEARKLISRETYVEIKVADIVDRAQSPVVADSLSNRDLVKVIFSRLSRSERRIFVLRAKGKSRAEITEITGFSKHKIKMSIEEARQRLKKWGITFKESMRED